MPRQGDPKPRTSADPSLRAGGYFELSQRPLHILAFLLPLLVVYEIGATVYLSDPDGGEAQTIAAWGMLERVFESFGVVGYHLPAALLVTVLLVWHVLLRDPWTLRLPVVVGMAMEACLWALPLTILAILIVGSGEAAPAAAQTTPGPGAAPDIHALAWQQRLVISLGAGLYEELLFRMILIAAGHALLVDLMRLPNWLGGALAIVAAAVAFTLYHRVPTDSPGAWSAISFYFLSGLFFGGLYLVRGFGLVVAVHALYDVVALVIIGR